MSRTYTALYAYRAASPRCHDPAVGLADWRRGHGSTTGHVALVNLRISAR